MSRQVILTEGVPLDDEQEATAEPEGLIASSAPSLDAAIARAKAESLAHHLAPRDRKLAQVKYDGLRVARNLGGIFTGETTWGELLFGGDDD